MNDILLECCKIMIDILSTLRVQEKITEEEYQNHIKLKIEYIELNK